MLNNLFAYCVATRIFDAMHDLLEEIQSTRRCPTRSIYGLFLCAVFVTSVRQ
ncbi:hypothetical protein BSIN_3264 [Burkholderia singularis]|uniref:Uncharacterized protein n=1 Tax=Burkholderia singularis TaxID=1503053 RepID=A0A238H485_9BURK|nr:hypothetical protein BSIN_3264 [Burkholderia singularis]